MKPLKVYCGDYASSERQLFMSVGAAITTKIKDADVVLFQGGEDVNPALYNEDVLPKTNFSDNRDASDIEMWREAKDKIKVGICRGGQFLNVMSGGKLWQHVDGHCRNHNLTDVASGRVYRVSSTHHQMFRPAKNAVVIATARESTEKYSASQSWRLKNDGTEVDEYFKKDFEVVYYPDTASLCFQPHPEYDEPKTTAVYFKNVWDRMLKGEFDK